MILDMLLKRVMGDPDLLLKLILRLLRLAVMHTDNTLDDRIIEMFQQGTGEADVLEITGEELDT